MQIFITSKDPNECAENLDSQRLLKQVIESAQIIRTIESNDPTAAWVNHPCVKQWRPFVGYAKLLKNCYVRALKQRTTKNGQPFNLKADCFKLEDLTGLDLTKPFFMEDESILTVYRGNLLRKAQEAKQKKNLDHHNWYVNRLGWKDKIWNGYIWCYEGQRFWTTLKEPEAKVDKNGRSRKRKRDPDSKPRLKNVTYLVEGPEHTIVREIIKEKPKKKSKKQQEQEEEEEEQEKKGDATTAASHETVVVVKQEEVKVKIEESTAMVTDSNNNSSNNSSTAASTTVSTASTSSSMDTHSDELPTSAGDKAAAKRKSGKGNSKGKSKAASIKQENAEGKDGDDNSANGEAVKKKSARPRKRRKLA